MDAVAGDRIGGRYVVRRAIGRGGMGTVWLCRDEVLGRDVAVKQIGALPGESESETRRAMREARSAAALNHANAVAVYDVVDHDGTPWLVMEYVDGETLADAVRREGRLDPRDVARIGSQLAAALVRAHDRRIVHRDIKPGNVLIDGAGTPKISDFGIARGYGDDQLTQTGFLTGTPGYLSPELARGDDPGPASDVWALGATLYQAVEGRAPYEPRPNPIALLQAIASESPRAMVHAGPLAGSIAAMMASPDRRWDMATAAEQLGRVARGEAAVLPAGVEEPPAPVSSGEAAGVGPAAAMSARDGSVASVGSSVRSSAPPATDDADGAGGVDRPGEPTASWATPAEGRHRRRRSRIALLLTGLLLVLLLGGGYWLSQRGDAGATPGAGGAGGAGTSTSPPRSSSASTSTSTSSTTSSSTTSSSTTSTSTTSTRSSSSTSSSPTASSSPSSTPSSTTSPPPTDAQLAGFLRDYFARVTQAPSDTWTLLTPRMQAAAGGRDGYLAFWSGIASVRTSNVEADASAGSAVLTLTYTRDDGSTSIERHRIDVVRSGDGFLIDGESNLG